MQKRSTWLCVVQEAVLLLGDRRACSALAG